MKSSENRSLVKDDILDKNLVTVCGQYCGSCGIYLSTKKSDTIKILEYALVLNQSFEDTLCEGCRGNKKSAHCSKMCPFIKCSKEKNVNHCGDCKDFPCEKLLEFQAKMPHRVDILKSLIVLKESGEENWLTDMHKRFSCSNCKTVNSGYDISCVKCKRTPGSEFVSEHRSVIEDHLAT
ncbi:MAG: DUF3795 domain-containing protein [Bacteroidetes bacterium]|nr:DUF3795 domain-containing protein [Bacteroidota bacterium]